MSFQEKLEKNIWGLIIMVALTEEEDSIRPYTALEQEGRDIYVREGC